MTDPAELSIDDPRLAVHQKAEDGMAKLRAGLEWHLPSPPTAGAAFHYASQLIQARAVLTGVQHFRSLHEHCSGVVWWQLNDCWPAISWAIVDVAGRTKLSWFAVRQAFAPRLAILGGTRADARLTLVNDTDGPWSAKVLLVAATVDGRIVDEVEVELHVPAHRAVTSAVADDLGPLPEDVDLLAVDVEGQRSTRWLRGDLELPVGPSWFEVETLTSPAADEVLVQVRALGLVRDLCLLAELEIPGARVDTQLHTLLPGESVTFRVTGPGVREITTEGWRELLWSEGRIR